MKEKLMKILKDLRADVDFEKEKKLIDDGILDSFDIVTLVSELNSEFDVEINVDEKLKEVKLPECENIILFSVVVEA